MDEAVESDFSQTLVRAARSTRARMPAFQSRHLAVELLSPQQHEAVNVT